MKARAIFSGAAVCVLLLTAGGCGESEGTGENPTATAYVSSSLCEAAKARLAERGGRVGEVRVRVVCLPEATDRDGNPDLAKLGAGARRVTEDSSTVAYAEPAGFANRFVPPIVEAAGIAITYTSSGQLAMNRILAALQRAGDSDALREAMAEELNGL